MESDFANYMGKFEDSVQGSIEASFVKISLGAGGKGYVENQSSFGNLRKQEIDLQQLMKDVKDRYVSKVSVVVARRDCWAEKTWASCNHQPIDFVVLLQFENHFYCKLSYSRQIIYTKMKFSIFWNLVSQTFLVLKTSLCNFILCFCMNYHLGQKLTPPFFGGLYSGNNLGKKKELCYWGIGYGNWIQNC